MKINKNELEITYLKKILNIKNKYLKENKISFYGKYYCLDEESLHKELDEVLIKLIKELGYNKIVEEYLEAEEYFWYS